MKVPFSYLDEKFSDCLNEGHPILTGLRKLMKSGDFTLGKEVQEFEQLYAKLIGVRYAVGVANGTDALRISLRLAGVRPGDEVITAANTFVASAGCIDELFATPVFVDMAPNHVLDASLIEGKITNKTKAIVPVWFTGEAPQMEKVMSIANKYNIPVIEDACQATLAEYKGICAGNFGLAGAISLHPLKVLNGCGDGGMIVTNDPAFYEHVKRYRNHGLVGRNNISYFGCNSRLDTVQAVFLNHLIHETRGATEMRRANAGYYDRELSKIEGVHVTKRSSDSKSCYHLYFIEVGSEIRNALVEHLVEDEIEARVHYPIPLQGALTVTGHGREQFPKAFAQSDRIVTLPVHEHLNKEQLDHVIQSVQDFMNA